MRPPPPLETRWQPGQSGNPAGRPKAVRELLDLARRGVPSAFAFAFKLLQDEREASRDRLEAAKFIVAYGLGAPPKQPHADELDEMPTEELKRQVLERLTLEFADRKNAQ